MKVLKFGGGCLKDAEFIKKLPKILTNYNNEQVVIVISAFGKITNMLEQFKFQEVFDFVVSIMDELGLSSDQKNTILYKPLSPSYFCNYSMANFINQYEKIKLLQKGTILSYPSRVCIGEYLSSSIIYSYLTNQSIHSLLMDASLCVYTDAWIQDVHSASFKYCKLPVHCSPFYNTNGPLSDLEKPKNNIIITQGFIARSNCDITSSPKSESLPMQLLPAQRTTLGREGSDYSAAIFAEMFNANELILFKDVDGVYSSDPKKDNNATLFSSLSYQEALDLCEGGNMIIHPKTMCILEKANIPIRIKNFNNLNVLGTLIS